MNYSYVDKESGEIITREFFSWESFNSFLNNSRGMFGRVKSSKNMTWGGNNFNGNRNSGGNNFNGNNNRNNGGGFNNNQPRKKHSGAKVVNITKGSNKGKWGISAWNTSRDRGMVSVLITPYGKTDQHKSKSGRIWENWMVKCFYKRTGQEQLFSALVDPSTRKAIIKDLGWIVNPGAANGGYCGTFSRK